jgi:hypothetical protein
VCEIEGWGVYLERESESVYETEFEKSERVNPYMRRSLRRRGEGKGVREKHCAREGGEDGGGVSVERTIRNGEMEGEEGEGGRGKEGERDLERGQR